MGRRSYSKQDQHQWSKSPVFGMRVDGQDCRNKTEYNNKQYYFFPNNTCVTLMLAQRNLSHHKVNKFC